MKLSHRQIEALEDSARDPGRPPSRDPLAADEAADADRVVRALEDAQWAIAHADAPAPAGRSVSAPSATIPVTDWQPVATAPEQRDLEVRVDDRVGRYSLLYPCRLVTGIGWINALGKRKLSAEPVEWRDWLEEFPDFR